MKLGSRSTAVIFPGVRRLRPPRTVDLAHGPGPASPSPQELPDHPQNDPPRAAWPPGSPVEQPPARQGQPQPETEPSPQQDSDWRAPSSWAVALVVDWGASRRPLELPADGLH